jgi:hypothetical protein
MSITEDAIRRAVLVAHANDARFVELVGMAELDRATAFRGASLRNTDLRSQELSGFDFTDANFDGADLRGADFSGSLGMLSGSFRNAQVDSTTKLPAALEWSLAHYNRLHDQSDWVELEDYCRLSVAIDDKNGAATQKLSHVLGIHLGNYKEALMLADLNIVTSLTDPNVRVDRARILGNIPSRWQEGVSILEELFDNVAFGNRQKISLLSIIFDILKRNNAGPKALKRNLSQQILYGTDSESMNSIAWEMYLIGSNLNRACNLAEKAHSNSPENMNTLHTLCAILARKHDWERFYPYFGKWFNGVGVERLKSGWAEYAPMFADAVQEGQGEKLVRVLESGRIPEWTLISDAIRLAIGATTVTEASAAVVAIAGEFSKSPGRQRRAGAGWPTDPPASPHFSHWGSTEPE